MKSISLFKNQRTLEIQNKLLFLKKQLSNPRQMFISDLLLFILQDYKSNELKLNKRSFNLANSKTRNGILSNIGIKKQNIFTQYLKSQYQSMIFCICEIKLFLQQRNNSIIKRTPYSTERNHKYQSNYLKYKFEVYYDESIFKTKNLQKFEPNFKKLQKVNKIYIKLIPFFTKKQEICQNIDDIYFRQIQSPINQGVLPFEAESKYKIHRIIAQKDARQLMISKKCDSYFIQNQSKKKNPQKKDNVPHIIQQNSLDQSHTSISCESILINTIPSKYTNIKLQIYSLNYMKRKFIQKGSVSKIQISEKLRKKLQKITNTSKKRNFSQLQKNKQFKLCVKSILSFNKNQLLGGGGCCSKSEINESNFSAIQISDQTQNNNHQNKEFENEYKKWTQQEIISQIIESNSQLKAQKTMLKLCVIDQILQSEDLINTYQSEIQQIFEVYLILELTRVSQKSDVQQEEFEKILHVLKSIESFEQDYAIKELVFYIETLTRLNEINHKFDENQIKEIIKIKGLINRILMFNKNKDFSDVKQSVIEIKQNLHFFDKIKELFPLKYQIEVWLRKIEQFGDKFMEISEKEEILFYVNIFFENKKKSNSQDYIILTLIRINFILEKFQQEISLHHNKIQICSQFSDSLFKANIDEFLNELMQNSDKYNNQVLLIFSIENQNYRYITLSILLSIYSIFTISQQIMQNQDYLIDFLCNKYLTEQELAIRVIFERSQEFVKQFNVMIKIESFKQKMIAFDKQRKEKLQPYVTSLKNHERSISSFDDIIKLISDNAIQKWERDIKKRQRSNIAQKDDVLLEVRDLYINQMITYLNGNPIFQKSIDKNSQVNEHSTQQQNALQDILKLFLNPDYSYRLNCINNQSSENEDKGRDIFKSQSNQCQILGILAEGGTGKSMFMKKIETLLIEKLTKLNAENETGNYLPIMVKCNSLNPKNPSLDEYLKEQGINEDMVQNLKQNERNKLILLDGYDEYTGDYFVVYSSLKINEWKNTKIIIATRKEKLSEKDACSYFSKQNELGERDEMSYTLVRLEEFTSKDIHEYADRYFKQERKTDQINQIEKDLINLRDCLTNIELEKLLHLPINLYLFTRMLVILDDKEIQNLKSNVSDQIGIQEIFFSDQFEREAQSFIDAHIKSINLKTDKTFRTSIKNCYFEYFQIIAMMMFKNKDTIQGNYLQVEKQSIKFDISQSITQILQQQQLINSLLDKVKNYINSKIITRVKSEEQQKIQKQYEKNQQQQFVEFKHKSLYEYFVARAMQNDFDIHGENIYKLKIEELEQFKINQKSIMNSGQNQSEQQILIKLYKLMKSQIECEEFSKNYHENQIDKNNRYIQYLKRSKIQTNTDISQIDIGASNLISALFLSKFSYSKLNLSLCSFSKAYINTPKSLEINFDRCNLQYAFLKNSLINFDSCNTQLACFDVFQKVFDTNNIYSFQKVIWSKNNILYSISQSGYINAFKLINQDIQLLQSKQLSQTFLFDIQFENDNNLLVSSKFTLFLINSITFEIYQTHKFTQPISNFTLIEDQILVVFQNQSVFKGTFKDGFKKLNKIGGMKGSLCNQTHTILVTYQNLSFSIWDIKKNFELITAIQGHELFISSVAFSTDGKYLATGSYDQTCKIWNAEKGFELISTIQGHTEYISFIAFSVDGKYLATGSGDQTCKIWSTEKDFDLINSIYEYTDGISSVAFSDDGKYLTASSWDQTCKIWNAEKDFELINTIQGHSSTICSVVFSADGKHLATSSGDKTCKIWNAQKSFELIKTILGHSDRISSIAFSVDGKYLVTGSFDQSCKIWNVENDFELINTIQGHSDRISSVAFSADGKYLATSSFDQTCKIWNAKKGFQLINTLQGHTGWIISIAFSSDGKFLATGATDQTCKIWYAEKGFELINTIKGHKNWISSVAFSADGKYLATGSGDQTCKIWNVEKDFELINIIKGHTDWISSVAFSLNGKYLATGMEDQTCKIWNVKKGFELSNTIQGHNDRISSISFSVDGKYLATGSGDQTCKIWNTEKGFEIINIIQGHTKEISFVAFSEDGKFLSTGSFDNTCKIWNAEKGFELINTIQGHNDRISSVAFSVSRKYLATGSFDHTCKIWNTEKGFELIHTIQGHSDRICSIAFSVGGQYLATGSFDHTCKIWNAEKGFVLLNTIKGHTREICSVAFSQDGKYLATGSGDQFCKIWNVEKGIEPINIIEGHTREISSVAFSVNGKYLATGSFDKTCKIWNAEKGFDLINTIQGHTKEVSSVAFSVDGKYLATGSFDNTCKIWNLGQDCELINTIQGHTHWISSVAFSVDGKYIATGSRDQSCQIWNAEKNFLKILQIEQICKIEISRDNKYVFLEQSDKNSKIYDLSTLEIINQKIGENVKEKYQFQEFQKNNYQKLNLFDNLYIV